MKTRVNSGVFIKGLIVGGSMVVPGVSGGTMAMLLRIYDRLIYSVNALTRREWKALPFLLLFALGGGLGIIAISNPLSYLLETYPQPTRFFFMGAVLGGIPLMYKKASVTQFSYKVILYPLLGAAIVASMQLLKKASFQLDNLTGIGSYLLLFGVGIFIAAALVLPGISGSFMLLVLGLYDKAILAAKDPFHNLAFLLPLALGALIGIFLTTGVLEKAMEKYPQGTYLIIFGFVLGSLVEVWPGFPAGIQIPISLGLLLLSTLTLFSLSRLEDSSQA